VSTFNSTFDGNKAFDGGAIYAMGGSTIDLTHTTMVDNDAAGEAGGVYLVAGSDVVLRAAIVSDNTAPAFPDVNDPMVDIDHSILGDSTGVALNGAGFMVGVDPKLGPLADNGGLTLTRMPFPDSPAIDTGTAAILVESPFLDQRGRSRDGSPPDMGSVEVTTGSVEDDMGPVEDAQDESQIWVPTSPARFVDTRSNGETIDDLHEATGAFGNSEQRTITFAGRGDVPADAVGVIANVTAVNPAGKGFVTAHPCANPRPNSASLNYSAGVNLGNEIILGLDSGDACIFTSGATHLTVDVVGYIPAESPYSAITPARYADTRDVGITFDGMVQAGGAPGAVGQLTVPVAGRGTVPADAAAAVMYVSAVTPAGNGFVTVWNCDGPAPLASSLNHVPGVNRGNEIVADIGPDGDVCLFTSTSVDLTVDVVGYLPAGTNYESLDAPARLLDTREAGVTVDGTFVGEGQVGAGESVELIVGGRAGIPDLASTVTVNVTAVNPTAPGFVTVYDCVGQPPLASSLNYVPGVNGGNEIVASVNANGRLCLFTSAATHLTADATGYTSL
jgi:predicted outer membrane repeat protein